MERHYDDPQLCPFPYFRKYWMAEIALIFARRAGNEEGNDNTRKQTLYAYNALKTLLVIMFNIQLSVWPFSIVHDVLTHLLSTCLLTVN